MLAQIQKVQNAWRLQMILKAGVFTATFFATMGALPAFAGGPTVTVDEPAAAVAEVVQDWKGLHFGLAAARPNGENFWVDGSTSLGSEPGDFSGSLPTVSAGYDWQRGQLVYGVTLTVSGGDVTAEPATTVSFGCEGCEFSVDKLATLRGRVGWSLGKTLVYATAGAARGHAIGTTNDGSSIHGEEDLTGWAAGLGVERYVGRKITLSAEYLETDFGRMELPTGCNTDCYTDVSFGLLQVGVNYRW
jgi:outer membrane immunogenic protein